MSRLSEVLTKISFAISKGFWEAFFETAKRQQRAFLERSTNDEDRDLIDRAADMLRVLSAGDDRGKPGQTASSRKGPTRPGGP